jgi:hypothetical protein
MNENEIRRVADIIIQQIGLRTDLRQEWLNFFRNLISKDNGEMLRSLLRYQAELNNEILLDKIDSIGETYGLGRGLKIILDRLISLFVENGLRFHYNFGEEIRINNPEDLHPFEFRGEPFQENEEKIVRVVDIGVSFEDVLLLRPIVEKVRR